MSKELRKNPRIEFDRGIDVQIMGIDGTWRRQCRMMDVSEKGALLTIVGSFAGLDLKEFFLLLSSTGLAYRKCKLVRVNGDLGRLGGLLKLWLTDDAKLEEMAPERMPVVIRGVLSKIEANQEELAGIIRKVLRSRQDFSG